MDQTWVAGPGRNSFEARCEGFINSHRTIARATPTAPRPDRCLRPILQGARKARWLIEAVLICWIQVGTAIEKSVSAPQFCASVHARGVAATAGRSTCPPDLMVDLLYFYATDAAVAGTLGERWP